MFLPRQSCNIELMILKEAAPPLSVAHLHKWQEAEKAQLRHHCRHHEILFSPISPSDSTVLSKVLTLLRDFRHHTEENNRSSAENKLDEAISVHKGELETVLVMDADKTLSAAATGALFWEKLFSSRSWGNEESPLKTLFSGPLGYSYTAFRQPILLYEETVNDQEFDALCQDVASAVAMHPEFVSLLHLVVRKKKRLEQWLLLAGCVVFGRRC